MAKSSLRYKWNGGEVTKDVERAIEIALHTGIQIIEANAKTLALLDTGNLRGSIRNLVDASRKSAWVFTDVKYAIYVEFGTGVYAENGQGRKTAWMFRGRDGKMYWTHGMKPNSFMRLSMDNNEERVQRLMGQIISQSLKKWSGEK